MRKRSAIKLCLEAAAKKLTIAMKEVLLKLLGGPMSGDKLGSMETLQALTDMGLIEYNSKTHEVSLSDKGKEAAEAYKIEKRGKQDKTNAAARGKADAMKSLGMKKTRYGGWE